MDLLIKFKSYLEGRKNPASKFTVKNYLVDVKKFINWYETRFQKAFAAANITPQLIEEFKKDKAEGVSARSIDRYLSSLRLFFHFLKLEEVIRVDPFEEAQRTAETNKSAHDLYQLKNFKSYLYVYNASHLTIKNYIIDVKQFLKWAEEVTGVKDAWNVKDKNIFTKIDSSVVEEYKQRLIESGFAPLSVNRKLSSLRKYLGWATEEGLLRANTDTLNIANEKANTCESLFGVNSLSSSRPLAFEQKEAPANVKPTRPYSSFAPVRLGQKITKGINLALDTTLISSLAKAVEQGQFLAWKLRGRPVFDSAELSKAPAMPSNIKKLSYAPLSIATRYLPFHRKIWHIARHSRPNWYRQYHSYSVSHYFHFAILMIFMSALGFGFYQNFLVDPKSKGPAMAAAVSPLKILSFQGRLTDASDNPITATKWIRVVIYNDSSASGAARLWEEVNSVSPDTDGIFSMLLGDNGSGANAALCNSGDPPTSPPIGACGIPQSLFANNAALYLGVTVEADPELTPRQQLATVAYATNAETLQGLPPITDAGVTTNANAVLALNSSGQVSISGTATTTFQSTGGQLTITGKTLLLNSASGTDTNIQLVPDGLGKIDIQKPILNSTNNSNIATAQGGVEVDDIFAVLATSSAQSAFTVNQDDAGPLISASTSGVAKFTVDNSGNTTLAGDLAVNGATSADITSTTTTASLFDATVTTLNIGAAATAWDIGAGTGTGTVNNATLAITGLIDANGAGTHDIAGTLNLSGNTLTASTDLTLNPAGGQVLFANGDTFNIGGVTALDYNAISDSGTTGHALASDNDLYVEGDVEIDGTLYVDGSLEGPATGTSGYWQRALGALAPRNITDDLLIGGTASSSAKFQVFGVGTYAGYASTSASLTFNDAAGTNPSINIFNSNQLDIKTSVGGDGGLGTVMSILNSGNVGIGDTTPDYLLELYDSTNTPAFALSDDDITHGVTTLAQTDVFAHLSSISTTVGGLQVTGLADATGIALGLKGIQSSDPTDTTPAISLIGAKANGTGVQDLTAIETVLQIANNDDAAALTILGDGSIGIGTSTPIRKLDVTGSVTTANSLNVISRPNEIAAATYKASDATGWNSYSGGGVTSQAADATNGLHTRFLRFTSDADGDGSDRIFGNGGAHSEDFVDGKTYLISFMYRATNGFSIKDRDALITNISANTGKAKYFEILYTKSGTATSDRFLVCTGSSCNGANSNQVDIGELTIQNITDDAPATRFFASAGSDGNVGIGTASPNRKLDVNGVIRNSTSSDASPYTQERISVYNDGTNWAYLGYGSDAVMRMVYSTTAEGQNHPMYFGVSSASDNSGAFTTRVAFDYSGNVGIGDESPDYQLELYDATNTPTFALSDDDVGHGVTTLAQTDVFAHLSSISTTVGGLQVTGLADATGIALGLKGVQSSDPTDTTPAISLIGTKANGTGVQDLLDAETVLQIANNDNAAALTVLGNGNVGIGTATPLEVLGVTGNATMSGTLAVSTIKPPTGALNLQYKSGPNTWANSLTVLDNSGNVGIGTTGPGTKLDVIGGDVELYAGKNLGTTTVGANGTSGTIYGFGLDKNKVEGGDPTSGFAIVTGSNQESPIVWMYKSAGNNAFQVRNVEWAGSVAAGNVLFNVDVDGNVGIGDTSPDYLLELNDTTNTPTFGLSDDDVLHGVTTLANTDSFFHLTSISTTAGGAQLTGLADATGIALGLKGVQSSDPTDTTPAISLIGTKADGTGVQDLTDAETVLQIANNDNTAALTVLGNGNIGIGTVSPSEKLEIAGNIELSGLINSNNSYAYLASNYGLGLRNLANGTAANSQEVLLDESATNLLNNPRPATSGTDNWQCWIAAETCSTANLTDATMPGVGGHAIRTTNTGASAHDFASQANYTNPMSITSGQSYTVSFYAKSSAAKTVGVYIQRVVDPWDGITDTVNASVTTSWQKFSVKLTASATTNGALVFYVSSVAASGTFDVANVLVENRAYATSYFDGAMGAGYAWTGTAHNSTSVRGSGIYFGTSTSKIAYIDSTNGNISASGSAMFSGTSDNFFMGNIGIGDASPAEKLEIAGNLRFSNGADRTVSITAASSGNGNNFTVLAGNGSGGITAGGDFYLGGGTGGEGGGGDVFIYGGSGLGPGAGNIFLGYTGSDAQGNVGIGGSSATEALDINGSGADITFSNTTGPHQILTGGTSNLALMPGGNVGVGTTTPTALLDIAGATGASTSGILTFRGTTDPKINILNGEDLIFQTSPGGDAGLGTKVTLLNNGSLGIGASPARKLHVEGDARITTSVSVTDTLTLCTDASGDIELKSGACSFSSLRYKENIEEISYGLNEIEQLRPVFYSEKNFDENNSYGRTKRRIGFIAEEMQSIIPEVVILDKEGRPDSLDYAFLTSLLAKGIQQLDKKVELLSDAIISNLQTGFLTTREIVTDSLKITTDSVTVGSQNLREYIVSVIENYELASQDDVLRGYGGKIISPIAEVDRVYTNIISPLAQGSNISISLENSKFEIRNSKDASGSAVATIDSSGNASFSGQISANQASISGNLNASEASIAGTLRAKNIIADSIEGLDERIASSKLASSSADPNYTLDASQLNAMDIASFSSQLARLDELTARLAYVENLSASTLAVNQGLMVFGPTSLSDLSVVNQLSIGGNLILADNSINVLGSTLEIQPLKQGAISMMGGMVEIDIDGNFVAKGNVTVKGILAANIISPIPDSDLVIKLGNKESGIMNQGENHNSSFIIRNSSDSAVLKINQLGDVIASGAGSFAKLNLSPVSPALAISDTEVIATGSAGVATISARMNELTVRNNLVTDNSLIYITPVGDTANQVLYLMRQLPQESFTIGIGQPTAKEIPFNWMIVN